MTRRTATGEASFWQHARDFLHDYCPKTRRMSPKTIEAYRIGLENYLSYLDAERHIARQHVSFDHFDRSAIRGYSDWMTTVKGYSAKTVDLRLTVIKSFLRFAGWKDPGLMALHETASQVKAPKTPRKPVEHMTGEATAAILAAHDGTTVKSRRNRMLLILLYDSAARVSEITGATLTDLHLTGPAFITLTGKGGKTRHMPLMGKTVEHLRVYLDEFHPPTKHPAPDTPLFYSLKRGQPDALSTDTIAAILARAADIARAACPDIPDRVHCHLVRKTRAMDLYTDAIPLPLIMQMLGHESMSTTSTFYAFATMKMMTDAIQTANPATISEPPTWKEKTVIDALYSL